MKKNNYIMLAIALSMSLNGCQKEEHTIDRNGSKAELLLAPEVEGNGTGRTRAVGDDFFVQGDAIMVELTTNKGGAAQTYNYVYGSDRIFRGSPAAYHFPLDDTYITDLTAKWPGDTERAQGLVTDQRLLADYKSADWMTGAKSSSVEGIMATDAPVPLVFTRENVLLDFELVGQNTTGLNIEELLIELQTTAEGGARAFWAYCGNPNGHAELIMEAGSRILSSENYLIGRIRVEGQSNDYTIIFPQTDITLQAGHRYLITLTPQGYFMEAFVTIVSFEEGDGGIGIPFPQPVPDGNGNFVLSNPLQLVALAYLVRNYDDGRSFVWSQRNYIIADGFTMTPEAAARYIPISTSIFSGTIQNTAGQPVTQFTYGDGQVLEIFTNNNQ